MGYTILYDKRLVQLSDGRYFFMLQLGESNVKERINGRYYPQKKWTVLKDEKSQKMFFTMGELQYQIFRRIADSINEDGTTNLAYGKGQFFETPNDLRRFFTTGLKNAVTIEQLEEAKNGLYVGCRKEGVSDEVKMLIEGEEELLSTVADMQEKLGDGVYIGFNNRNLNALHIKGQFKELYKQTSQWYTISGMLNREGDEPKKVYFRRRSNRRLFVTDDLSEAKPFATEEEAQKCMGDFPELKDNIDFYIEEQTEEIMMKRRVYIKNQKEIEQE